MSKLTRPQIYIIGGVLSVAIGLTGYFTLIDPANKQLQEYTDKRDKRKLKANELTAVKKRKEDAKKTVKDAYIEWRRYETRKMPNIDVSNTYSAWQDVINERLNVLGPLVYIHLKSDKNVRLIDYNIDIPNPPSDPNESLRDIDVYKGKVTVSGTFKNVLAHVERWNDFERLAVVRNLSLSGSSPNLNASYDLDVIEYSNGDLSKAVSIPQATGGGAAGTTGFGITGGMMGGAGMRGGGGPMMGAPMSGGGAPAGGGGGVKGGD